MGENEQRPSGGAMLRIDVTGSERIGRVDNFNGREHLATHRRYSEAELGNRIRVIWEGAEYRGRFREVIWDGRAEFSGNKIVRARGINFFNADKTLDRTSDNALQWWALTTGNFGGFDAWLEEGLSGSIDIQTPVVSEKVEIKSIGFEDTVFDAGKLGRKLRLFRLPGDNPHVQMSVEQDIALRGKGDNPLYVRVTQEDGNQAWSSPIYIFR